MIMEADERNRNPQQSHAEVNGVGMVILWLVCGPQMGSLDCCRGDVPHGNLECDGVMGRF